jgi:hypothetical protein
VYEEANYIEAAKTLPRVGKRVETPDGIGRVGDLDVLRGRVRVLFQDGPPKVFEGREVKLKPLPSGAPPTVELADDDSPPRDGDRGGDRGGDRDGDDDKRGTPRG